MNKKLVSLMMLGSMVSAFSAFAVFDPTWERPIAVAQLVEIEEGHEVGIGLDKELTLNRRDGSEEATTLQLEEERQVQCITAPCNPIKEKLYFRVVNVKKTSCGATVYKAVENTRILHPRELTLIDNTSNICEVFNHKYLWTVQIPEGGKVRRLYGNPESVVTIESVLR